eukprot:133416-Chlamydomonas_euryale.AAC.1
MCALTEARARTVDVCTHRGACPHHTRAPTRLPMCVPTPAHAHSTCARAHTAQVCAFTPHTCAHAPLGGRVFAHQCTRRVGDRRRHKPHRADACSADGGHGVCAVGVWRRADAPRLQFCALGRVLPTATRVSQVRRGMQSGEAGHAVGPRASASMQLRRSCAGCIREPPRHGRVRVVLMGTNFTKCCERWC